MAKPPLLTLTEVARVMRRTPSGIHRAIREGRWPAELPIVDFLGNRHVRTADLEQYLGTTIAIEPNTSFEVLEAAS